MHKVPSKLSNDELIDLLKIKAAELGDTPTWADITLDQRFPSPATLSNRFGSYNQALAAAGLAPREYHQRTRQPKPHFFGKQYKKAP